MRSRIADEMLVLFSDVGTDVVSLTDLYGAAERRYGDLLDRRPDPARPSQQKWQHDLRWEVQTAVSERRIVKRNDLGRALYSAPPVEATSEGTPAVGFIWDAILTVPASHDIERWKTFEEIFVPGSGRPRDIDVGSHLWLRFGYHLVWRAEVVAVEFRDSRRSSMDGTEHGPGWAIVVAGGAAADLSDERIGFTGRRWGQGLRYLHPIELRLRGRQPRGTSRARVRLAALEVVSPDPVVAHTHTALAVWNRIESRLVDDWALWCSTRGRRVLRPIVSTDEGTTLRADGFDEALGLLIEAKGSSSREHVRLAIGQVLDYSFLIGDAVRLRALLLPTPPTPSAQRLLSELEIGLIVREGDGFSERLPPYPEPTGRLVRTLPR
jgi:hypothetical protein